MKQGNMIIMGFLVVGVWYAVGYLQGLEVANYQLEREFQRGLTEGLAKSKPTPSDEQD